MENTLSVGRAATALTEVDKKEQDALATEKREEIGKEREGVERKERAPERPRTLDAEVGRREEVGERKKGVEDREKPLERPRGAESTGVSLVAPDFAAPPRDGGARDREKSHERSRAAEPTVINFVAPELTPPKDGRTEGVKKRQRIVESADTNFNFVAPEFREDRELPKKKRKKIRIREIF